MSEVAVRPIAMDSGQSPKFAKTAFGVWSNEVGQKTGTYTQYDTYLMRYKDICNPL